MAKPETNHAAITQSVTMEPKSLPLFDQGKDLLSESQFGELETRQQKRQRILENTSFETDSYNIYDPYFSSEEEYSSDSIRSGSLTSSVSPIKRNRHEETPLKTKSDESEKMTFGGMSPSQENNNSNLSPVSIVDKGSTFRNALDQGDSPL